MLTKSKIVLSALLVAGFASAAMANGPGGYAVGDNWVEPTVQQSPATSAFASANIGHSVKPFTPTERVAFDRATRYAASY